ncbi:hypothetical protein F383_28186 [Gossypium arboreum]|uniref:Uncharacterized protein n=1 Tax=Gossypium arboreum TaxID=29729 RepID=A0A0B0MMS9_GOSAR|nr:hypothetical protein F383_28186 [Gossypium arboreum]
MGVKREVTGGCLRPEGRRG